MRLLRNNKRTLLITVGACLAAGALFAGISIAGPSAPSRIAPTYVSSLPASPTDGQEVYYNAGSGTVWHFRYNASSSSPYKWEFIGGPGLITQDSATRSASTTSGAWGGIDANDPQLTVPLAGEWLVEHQARLSVSSGAATMCTGVRIGAAPAEAGSNDQLTACEYETIATAAQTPRGRGVVTIPSSNTALRQRYVQNSGTVTFTRQMSSLGATPVRVAG